MQTESLNILEPIKNRYSSRAFENQLISQSEVNSLLEAARWAPSAMNAQPWRFLLAQKGDKFYNSLAGMINDGNKPWAETAPCLILVAANTLAPNGAFNKHAWYDTGQAVAQMVIQAQYLGLNVRQMGGINYELIEEFIGNPSIEPVVMLAVGKKGNPEILPEPYKSRETSTRSRKSIEELILIPKEKELK